MKIEIYSSHLKNPSGESRDIKSNFYEILPQKIYRDWMSTEKMKYSYKCLPLKIANELGWQITCPINFYCIWDGTENTEGLKIFFEKESDKALDFVASHFGGGILTFGLPYIFRTPRKKALYLRGPTNFYKESCQYLDAVIETDWMNYTFTYNIKINKKNTKIYFSKGEPICSFIPINLKEISETSLINKKLNENKILSKLYIAFWRKRQKLGDAFAKGEIKSPHNLDYFNGGYKSIFDQNKVIGCPFLHFKSLNLKNVNESSLEDKFFSIRSKLRNFMMYYKNLILRLFFFYQVKKSIKDYETKKKNQK